MRFDIRYRLRFTYDEPISQAHNEIRVRPRDDAHQQVLSYRLVTEPPAKVLSSTDYWGNSVEHVGFRLPHTECALVAEASVETQPRSAAPEQTFEGVGVVPGVRPVRPRGAEEVDAELSERAFVEAHQEFLVPSEHVVSNEYLDAMAAQSVAGVGAVAPRVEGVVRQVRELLRYEQGTTDIGLTLTELALGGVGVCQDFAHLTVGMLRSVGIPARYVSGYLFAADETEVETASETAVETAAHQVRVQTHAWVEAQIPGYGWWGVDPTNGTAVGERHVIIGYGRDYGDVAPVRGVYQGEANPEVEAEVVIARLTPLRSTTMSEPYVRPQHIGHRQVGQVRNVQQQQQQ